MNAFYEHGSLRFAVLGPVRAWHGTQELDLGSPQQRLVLAVLLLRRGHLVTVAEFVDAVWGEEPPTAAVSVLRTYVSRLRKVLEPNRASGESPQVIASAADGYLARVSDDALDLGVFEQRVARAKKLHAVGEVSAAADLLHTALDGWHETPLAGLPGPLAQAERSRLNEKRLGTLEARLDIDLQLGRHSEVIAELSALAAEHPLRERLCRLLMLALYRSGRQAEALACYRRTRSTLVSELGVEPGTSLRELHNLILVAGASLDPSSPPQQSDPNARVLPPVPSVVRPAQLPADLPTFTGRGAELGRVRALFPVTGRLPSTVGVCVIGGMAGIGKTTLAVHWAHEIADRFPDGQLFINLRGFDPTSSMMTPEEAVRIFLDALGVPPQRIPTRLDAQASLYRSLLASRRALIVLDNARDADQIRPLLPGSPGCLVVVTSRNQLTGLIAADGAQPLTLHQLTSAEGTDFLARRLGAERMTAEPLAAQEIVARCGHLPLALAIVAARAATRPSFPLSAIADELREGHGSLDAFASGELGTDVRAVFSWSYQALSAPAARLFRLLSLHPGRDAISAPAVAAVAGLPRRKTRSLLDELTRAHLLTERLPGRYTTHDLLRVYATEQLLTDEPPAERDRAIERLLSWYLHTVDAAYPLLTPHRERVPAVPVPPDCRPLAFSTHEQAVQWCETERANLVAAIHRAAVSGHPGVAWRLTAALWGFFYLRRHLHDWLDTSRAALSATCAAHDRKGEAWSLGGVADALTQMNRFDEAIDHYRRQMALYRELGDSDGKGRCMVSLGNAYLQVGQLDKAVEYSRRALAINRGIGSAWGEGIALNNLGDAYQRLGRFDEANDCLEQALTITRITGNRWFEGNLLHILGRVANRLQRRDDAFEHYQRALEAHRDVGNRWGEGHTLSSLGEGQMLAGEAGAARTSWQQALMILTEFDDPHAENIRQRLRNMDDRTADARPSPFPSAR
ncbi:AfsR/SARP family transcriptional regulator [Streptomyces sp. NRRL S-813]|uniref:AfsR/SARP family transcriptional regulator n=1 Tax=Streptomyces sp. NRRL S-813 TaxID=1463919 RepID=UPI0005672E8D|nr:BTAD domain-containing putative transcriptional regulator [Streptomyces sp. NRRL S-813]